MAIKGQERIPSLSYLATVESTIPFSSYTEIVVSFLRNFYRGHDPIYLARQIKIELKAFPSWRITAGRGIHPETEKWETADEKNTEVFDSKLLRELSN